MKEGTVVEAGLAVAVSGRNDESALSSGERSGLLRGSEEGPRDGRAVIHTDSD